MYEYWLHIYIIYISLPDRDETINSSQQRRLVMAPLKSAGSRYRDFHISRRPWIGEGMVDDLWVYCKIHFRYPENLISTLSTNRNWWESKTLDCLENACPFQIQLLYNIYIYIQNNIFTIYFHFHETSVWVKIWVIKNKEAQYFFNHPTFWGRQFCPNAWWLGA
jgi:hypothetical protein